MEFFIMSHYHTIMVQCVWSIREGTKKERNYKWGFTEKKVSRTNEKNKIRIWLIANWTLFHNDPEKRHWEPSFKYSHTSFVWCHHQSGVSVCVTYSKSQCFYSHLPGFSLLLSGLWLDFHLVSLITPNCFIYQWSQDSWGTVLDISLCLTHHIDSWPLFL